MYKGESKSATASVNNVIVANDQRADFVHRQNPR